MLTRIVALAAALTATACLPRVAAAEDQRQGGPPLVSGDRGAVVLHCNALGIPGFVGAIVVNRNGEFGKCHFVPNAD